MEFVRGLRVGGGELGSEVGKSVVGMTEGAAGGFRWFSVDCGGVGSADPAAGSYSACLPRATKVPFGTFISATYSGGKKY